MSLYYSSKTHRNLNCGINMRNGVSFPKHVRQGTFPIQIRLRFTPPPSTAVFRAPRRGLSISSSVFFSTDDEYEPARPRSSSSPRLQRRLCSCLPKVSGRWIRGWLHGLLRCQNRSHNVGQRVCVSPGFEPSDALFMLQEVAIISIALKSSA